MNIEKFLGLFFQRNILIIEVLFGLVLLGVIFLTIRSFLRAEGAGNEMNLSGLEEGLKKILENHAGSSIAHANTSSAVEGDAIMEEMATQIERLKLQLMQKTEEVEQLKAGEGATTPASPIEASVAKTPIISGTPTELEEKVRDLEARLSEYSIIEDDIADLSFYKEETVRLQAEIDKLKAKLAEYEAGGVPPKFMAPPPPAAETNPLPSATPSPPAAIPPAAPSPQLVAEVPVVAPTTVASETTDVFGSIDDDIMAEFERAVAEQKASSSAQKVATELKPSPPRRVEPDPVLMATAPTAVPPPAAGPQQDVDAILKAAAEEKKTQEDATLKVIPSIEVASKMDPNANANEKPSLESIEAEEVVGINLDKMLSEVGGLPEESEGKEVSNALDQELDTEKLLQEATGMEKSDTEVDEDFNELIKKEGA